MKIVRDGVEYTLTDKEMHDAFVEQEHKYDVDDVREFFYGISQEDSLDRFGAPLSVMSANFDKIAYNKRRAQDKYDMNWFDAIEDAARDVAYELQKQSIK